MVFDKSKSLNTDIQTREIVKVKSIKSTDTKSLITRGPKSQKVKLKCVSSYLTLSSRCIREGKRKRNEVKEKSIKREA